MAAVAVREYAITRIKPGQDGRGAGSFGNINIGDMRHILTSNGNGRPVLALNNRWRVLTARRKNICTWGGGGYNSTRQGRWRVLSPVLRLIALLLLGVLTAACSADPTAMAPPLTTHLYALESKSVRLENFDGSGGAMERLGEDLLVVTTKGRFVLVSRDGTVEYLDGNVPMNYTALEEHEDYNNNFNPKIFRVADILLKELGEERYELFATHHYFTGKCIRFRLSSTTIRRDGEGVKFMSDWRTIFEVEPCLPLRWFAGHESGGKMLMDGADHLLAIIGRQGIGGWRAHPTFDPVDHLGKFISIAIETGDVETLAIGFRNSQGLARDGDGNLWATDHGPQGGDELNLLERGGNYGWPLVSYGVQYGNEIPPTIEDAVVGRHDDFARPAFAWVTSLGISAIAVNDERHFPLWKDDLLVASLAARSLYRVRRHGTEVQYVEQIEVGYRIRDLTFMPDGRIALLQDDGLVHFLGRSARYCTEAARERGDVYSIDCDSVALAPPPDSSGEGDPGAVVPSDEGEPVTDPAAGEQLFGAQCSVCHNLNVEEHDVGPHLVGILGRPAGQVEGYRFSAAFDSLDVVWTQDNLTKFLIDPERFAPGTTMASTGATAAEARAIAEYLTGH